jgi:hypothetical protein
MDIETSDAKWHMYDAQSTLRCGLKQEGMVPNTTLPLCHSKMSYQYLRYL